MNDQDQYPIPPEPIDPLGIVTTSAELRQDAQLSTNEREAWDVMCHLVATGKFPKFAPQDNSAQLRREAHNAHQKHRYDTNPTYRADVERCKVHQNRP